MKIKFKTYLNLRMHCNHDTRTISFSMVTDCVLFVKTCMLPSTRTSRNDWFVIVVLKNNRILLPYPNLKLIKK